MCTFNPSVDEALCSSHGRKSLIRGRIQKCTTAIAATITAASAPATHAARRASLRRTTGDATSGWMSVTRFRAGTFFCMEHIDEQHRQPYPPVTRFPHGSGDIIPACACHGHAKGNASG